jgi:subtilisin family serine protease
MRFLHPIRAAFPAALFVCALLLCGLLAAVPAAGAPSMMADEVIIKFKPGASDADVRAILADLGATRVKRFKAIQAEEQRITRRSVTDAVSRYRSHPAVQFIEPNWIVRADGVPNDPLFPQQWSLHNTGQAGGVPGADIDAVAAWDIQTGSAGVVVAIIDTGVDYTHPDLAPNIWTNPGEIAGNGVDDDGNGLVDDVHGYDFLNLDADPMDDNGHGTHVAGIVAARGNNGVGIAGVAWNVKIMPLKFLAPNGTGPVSAAIDCIEYAVAQGAQILNNSWGGFEFSAALELAVQHANDAGVLFVAAAGNDGLSLDENDHFPASFRQPNVIAVAATDARDELAGFSNYGPNSVPIAAPGTNIVSTFPGGSYLELSGTSMSVPLVSGALAILKSEFPSMSAPQMKSVLLHSADPAPALAGLVTAGARLNVLRMLAGPDSIAPAAVGDLMVVAAESNRMTLRWTATGDDGAAGTASRYDVRYDVAPIDEASFDRAPAAILVPRPKPAGSAEEYVLSGLQFQTTYYVALKVVDEFGNASGLSNLASGTTQGAPDVDVAPTSLTQSLETGQTAEQTVVLRNTGVGTLDFSIDTAPPRPAPAPSPARAPALVLAKGAEDPRVGEAAVDGRGGPDLFGHAWIDSDQPGGPIFAWTDISTIGTRIALSGDDEVSFFVPIGFTFPYYGGIFDFVRICTNGHLSFTGGATDFLNQPLPGILGPENMVAPFWDDLLFDLGSAAYAYGDEERFIVQWENVLRIGGGGPYTFQAILYRDGTIVFQYRTMGQPVTSATVGIQDGTRTDGLTIVFNHAYVHDNLAVRITASPRWLSATPSFGTLAPGQSAPIAVRFNAASLAAGDYDGAVRVSTNDPDEPSVSVAARLTVAGAPDISVEGGTLTFLNVPVGGSDTQSLFVTNRGSLPLTMTVTAVPPVFETAGGPFTLAAGEAMEVAVTFRPMAPGSISGTLTFLSNDPDEATSTVLLTATAILAPRIAVVPTRIVAAALPGERKHKKILLRNLGAVDLHWSVAVASEGPDTGWVSIAPRAGSLGPGRAAVLDARFDARALTAGDHAARASFSSDDPATPALPIDLVFHVGSVGVAAFVLEPATLDARRRGGWMTAHVELLPGFDPSRVVLSTVKLLGSVPPEDRTLRLVDFNRNGIPDLKFRFDRDRLLRALPPGDRVEVVITGEIRDSTYFQGVQTICVVHRRGDHRDDLALEDRALKPPHWAALSSVEGLETELGAAAPQAFALHPSAPNPTPGATLFRFDMAAPGRTTLRIFSVDGRLARGWELGLLPAGRHRLQWDGRGTSGTRLAAGVYFSRLEIAGAQPFEASRRLMLLH